MTDKDKVGGLNALLQGLASDAEKKQSEEAQKRQAEIDEYNSLPTVRHLCLATPLYDVTHTANKRWLAGLRDDDHQFDAYCTRCRADSIFKSIRRVTVTRNDDVWMLRAAYFDIHVECQREKAHTYKFCFLYQDGRLFKYGQVPSLEDIAGADIRKYESLLADGHFAELKRATGLASHGIGIGSFVYLRRIFERLIADHHGLLVVRGQGVDGFDSLRIDDKINRLKTVLPPALVKNRAAYKILSSGIHEMDEATCRKYFPVVRAAIIQILEQDLQAKERAKAEADLEAQIAAISSDIGKGG